MQQAPSGRRSAQLLIVAAILLVAVPAQSQELTPEEAVRIALEHNPSLQAAALDLRAADSAVDAAEEARAPVLSAGVSSGYDNSFGVGALTHAGDVVLDLGLSWASVYGTELSFQAVGSWDSAGARATTSGDNLSGSSYGAEAQVRVTQPLLRGAGRDVGEAAERAARLVRTASEHAQTDEASELVSHVLSAYWELWYAQQSRSVTVAARDLAERQLHEAQLRSETLGTSSRVDSLRFASELASLEEDLAQADVSLATRTMELGRLLGLSPDQTEGLSAAPAEPSSHLSLTADQVVHLARSESAALRELAANLDASRDRVAVAQDATLPRLDLTATVGVGGLWSDTSGALEDPDNGDLGVAAMVGLSLELPITNSRARAELAQTRTRADAAELRYEARERQLEVEALTTLERYESARAQVALASRSAEIARELANAEGEALHLGMSTTYQALEAQDSLRRSELRRLRALVDETAAAVTLEHLTGQLLSSLGENLGYEL